MRAVVLIGLLASSGTVSGLSAAERGWENPVYHRVEEAVAAARAQSPGVHRESPAGLRLFQTRSDPQIGQTMAMTAISILPLLVVFYSAQRYFIQGIVITGVKG